MIEIIRIMLAIIMLAVSIIVCIPLGVIEVLLWALVSENSILYCMYAKWYGSLILSMFAVAVDIVPKEEGEETNEMTDIINTLADELDNYLKKLKH